MYLKWHYEPTIFRTFKFHCTGVELALLAAGLGMSGAGAGLGIAGSAAANKNMNAAVENELSRQHQYQREGQVSLEQNIQEQSPRSADKSMKQGEEQAMQHYQALQSSGAPSKISAAVAPTAVTKNAVVGDTGNTQARSAVLNRAAVGPQGLDEMQLARAISDLKTKTKLAQNNMFAQQSESVLPLEIQAAQHSKDKQRSIGSLLQAAGALTSLGAMSLPASGAGAAITPAQSTALSAGAGPLQAGAAGLPYNALTNMLTGAGVLGGI